MNFTNPLYKRKPGDSSPQGQPDPYILQDNGSYYVYVTGSDGVHLYTSGNFCDWEYAGIALTEKGQKEYWAPAVVKIDGKYYMYYSSMESNSSDVHDQNIRAAVSDTPKGPFRFVKQLLPPFSIDADVVQTKNGLYMFYCQNVYDSVRAGTYITVDKMTDALSLEGKPVAAIKPTIDEEIFERNRFKKGQHWHTVEGAFYFREGDWHYLTYSGSAYTKESYFIGYASCFCEGEPDLRELNFIKRPSPDIYAPLLKADEKTEGTGHNSIIKIENDYYIIYHGRDTSAPKTQTDTRTFRASRLKVKDGVLKVIK